jgi:hypothetical protein
MFVVNIELIPTSYTIFVGTCILQMKRTLNILTTPTRQLMVTPRLMGL